jgi:nucleoid DNA-binding protein
MTNVQLIEVIQAYKEGKATEQNIYNAVGAFSEYMKDETQLTEVIQAYKDKKATAKDVQNAVEAFAEHIRKQKAELLSRLEEINELFSQKTNNT